MTKALATLQTRLYLLRSQQGQGTLEYVGMIIVAAIIVVAVLDAVDAIDLGAIFSDNIDKVTSRG